MVELVITKYIGELSNPDPEIRIGAAIELGGLANQQSIDSAIPALCRSIQDEDERVRYYSVGALSKIYRQVKSENQTKIINSITRLVGDQSGRIQNRAWHLISDHKFGYKS